MSVEVIFEDSSLIVAVKPFGVLSEDGDGGFPAMLREHTGGEIYPVHRLDRTTSGLMVYAKTRAAAAALSEAVRAGEMRKIYTAVAEGVTEEAATLKDLLFFDRRRGKSFVVGRERRGVKPAELSYERLSTGVFGGVEVSLLRVVLVTGRTHQIRVQLASRKHPLVGDRRYASCVKCGTIALFASSLSFPHPATGEELSFTLPPRGEAFETFPSACRSEHSEES